MCLRKVLLVPIRNRIWNLHWSKATSHRTQCKVQASICHNREVAPVIAAIPVHLDTHTTQRYCSRSSQPPARWPHSRWGHSGTEDFAYSLANAAAPAASMPKQVYTMIQQMIQQYWSQFPGTIYKVVKNERWVVGQIMMRRTGIVMPQSQGMVRAGAGCERKCGGRNWKKRFRKRYVHAIPASLWVPEQNQNLWGQAITWGALARDLSWSFEISNGAHLLVVVDYYSSWFHSLEEDRCATRDQMYGSHFHNTWVTRNFSQWQWTTICI